MKRRRSQFLNSTRWLPDSSFTTYFGKPAFHAYGKGNTNPTVGGVNYGHNMLSHNINAECGDHPPLYQQVYDSALKAGLEHTSGLRVPAIPLTKAVHAISEEQLQELIQRKPIMPKENRPQTAKKATTAKGGKPEKTVSKPKIKIAKPEMTLTGFEHTKENLRMKDKLARSERNTEMDRASESKRSRSQSVRSRDLRNPESASETSSNRAGSFGINKADVPPMNEEIENADLEEMSAQAME